ncbi:MAG: phosphoribosylglycinamide formyltransferase [Gammaproteobacteria bacterium]|nr:phosphoribosylglycinamide formyltransferase [Gammaproteobacteria bacterium]NND58706.1 phosphoribosylglycinamide formyltransferase [Gammaproteobacteria bacterium]
MSSRALVLISGGGTNLQSFIDAIAAGRLDAELVGVLSDQPRAFGLQRAERADIPTTVLGAGGYDSRESYDRALQEAMLQFEPELVLLAGFMRILGAGLVRQFEGRMLNVHPSLLPAYRGLHTHRRVLEAGDRRHGCSIHFVTEELDGGPVVAQAEVAVADDDTEQTLSARVQAREHMLFPAVAQWFVSGRLNCVGDKVSLDGRILSEPVVFPKEEEIV